MSDLEWTAKKYDGRTWNSNQTNKLTWSQHGSPRLSGCTIYSSAISILTNSNELVRSLINIMVSIRVNWVNLSYCILAISVNNFAHKMKQCYVWCPHLIKLHFRSFYILTQPYISWSISWHINSVVSLNKSVINLPELNQFYSYFIDKKTKIKWNETIYPELIKIFSPASMSTDLDSIEIPSVPT